MMTEEQARWLLRQLILSDRELRTSISVGKMEALEKQLLFIARNAGMVKA